MIDSTSSSPSQPSSVSAERVFRISFFASVLSLFFSPLTASQIVAPALIAGAGFFGLQLARKKRSAVLMKLYLPFIVACSFIYMRTYNLDLSSLELLIVLMRFLAIFVAVSSFLTIWLREMVKMSGDSQKDSR